MSGSETARAQSTLVVPVAGCGAPGVWFRSPLLLASLVTLVLGAVEDLYGNTDSGDVYGSDAVQYLDIARAMARHDWRSALNPLWSQGYPALLAALRPIFPAGPGGDWWLTRCTNFAIFAASYAAFLYLLFGLMPPPSTGTPLERQRWLRRAGACLLLFVAAQTCLGQVSRVNPDELVTTLFLLACALLLRMLGPQARQRSVASRLAMLLGAVLGAGFLVKAAFLGFGCAVLAVSAIALRGERRSLRPVFLASALFAGIVGSYGVALSHAVGHPTLGESGAINYAWHVNRLPKWVHWEGGVQPAAEAWPKPALARFAQWSTRPPEFGKPVHPSAILQQSPRVYGFAAPVHATYVPYFDPPYFYQGYRHVFRVRYQLIAAIKSLGDLSLVLLKQPIAWSLFAFLAFQLRSPDRKRAFQLWVRRHGPLLVCALLGIALYVPVHLEARYIAGPLLVLGTGCVLAATELQGSRKRTTGAALLLLGFVAELALYQGPAWRNLLHGKSPANNVEWQMGVAAAGQHLPPNAPIAVIAWTPNLHCDWAFIAHLEITSEIASGPDYTLFWRLSPERQAATLATFRQAGAAAVFVEDKPPGLGGPEWQQLNGTPLWMARLR